MESCVTSTCVRPPEGLLREERQHTSTHDQPHTASSGLRVEPQTHQLLGHSEDLLGLLIRALLLHTLSFQVADPQLLKQSVCPTGAMQENARLRFAHKHFVYEQKKVVTTSFCLTIQDVRLRAIHAGGCFLFFSPQSFS